MCWLVLTEDESSCVGLRSPGVRAHSKEVWQELLGKHAGKGAVGPAGKVTAGSRGLPMGCGVQGQGTAHCRHRTEQGVHEGLLCRPESWAALPSLCPQLPRGHLPESLMGVGGSLGPPLPGGGCPKCTHWVEGLLP